jgi:hypothetical protein
VKIPAKFAAETSRLIVKIAIKQFKLRVVQPKIPLIHPRSPFGDLESDFAADGKSVYGSQP